jgi:hypothetical protein
LIVDDEPEQTFSLDHNSHAFPDDSSQPNAPQSQPNSKKSGTIWPQENT